MKISLKAARINAGYKQDEIAHKIGVNRASISNWEKGTTRISGEVLFRLCEAYHISVDDIFLPIKSAKS